MRKICILMICGALLFISSCKDEEITYSEVPSLEFVSVTPLVVNEFQDELEFVIKYIDGDGDLGENDPNVVNLFLKDERINITHEYRISQLSPSGSSIPIAGNLRVVLESVGITDGTMLQTASFSIYMVDRAGHTSNVVLSPPVTIRKP